MSFSDVVVRKMEVAPKDVNGDAIKYKLIKIDPSVRLYGKGYRKNKHQVLLRRGIRIIWVGNWKKIFEKNLGTTRTILMITMRIRKWRDSLQESDKTR